MCASHSHFLMDCLPLSHSSSSFSRIPASALPSSLADLFVAEDSVFSISSSTSLVLFLMVLIFLLCVYICFDMPCTFCE